MAFMTKEWEEAEYFTVRDFNHVEFYVGNAKQGTFLPFCIWF